MFSSCVVAFARANPFSRNRARLPTLPPPPLFSLQSPGRANKSAQLKHKSSANPLNDLLDEAQADLDKMISKRRLIPFAKIYRRKADVAFVRFQLPMRLPR